MFAPSSDPSLTIKFYKRTPEQQASLGYLVGSTQIEGTHDQVPERGILSLPCFISIYYTRKGIHC